MASKRTPCPECGGGNSTYHERDGVEECDNCGWILWEDL